MGRKKLREKVRTRSTLFNSRDYFKLLYLRWFLQHLLRLLKDHKKIKIKKRRGEKKPEKRSEGDDTNSLLIVEIQSKYAHTLSFVKVVAEAQRLFRTFFPSVHGNSPTKK